MLYDHMSGGQYEGFMDTFSRSSSHAVDLSRAIASGLCLGKLADERADRADGGDGDTARIADLGSGPGVSLGWVLREEGLVREVFAQSAPPAAFAPPEARRAASGGGTLLCPVKAPPPGVIVGKTPAAAAAAAPLSVWCADPFYCNRPPAADDLSEPPASAGRGGFFGSSSHQETSLPTEDVGGGGAGCRLQVVGGGRVHFVSAEAVEFLQSCRERVGLLDRVLMKEMVHHVGDHAALGRGLREALRPGTGMALIAGRTPSDTIPWFPQAERQFAESCMDTEHICRVLRSVAGLRVATSEHVFDVHFKLADWCALLRGRFWSHLDTISDDDMERGISEVREAYGQDDSASVTFPDRFTFVQVFRDRDRDHDQDHDQDPPQAA